VNPRRSARRIAAWLLVGAAGAAAGGTLAGARAAGRSLTLLAVGDVMLDRGVAKGIAALGADAVFAAVAVRLREADLTIGNLECPLASKHPRLPKGIAFCADPALAPVLAAAGFDVMNLANNHAVDCGRVALLATIAHLNRAGIQVCGAGRDRAQAEGPVVLAAGGLRVAFVGFTEFVEGTRPYDHVPTIGLATARSIKAAVARARAVADLVVVSLHAGEENDVFPARLQRSFALAAAGAGADLVLGHHPHVLQGLEQVPRPGRRSALIIYSLGNFVFDQKRADANQSVMLRCRLDRNGVMAAETLPVVIRDTRPRPATAEEGRLILAELTRRSRRYHVSVSTGAVVGAL